MQDTGNQSIARDEQGTTADVVRAVDRHVAARIRSRRNAVGMTQKDLARAIGLSYQQIQKYETGTNRVGAGRLHAIGRALNVAAAYFFDGTGSDNFRATVAQKTGEISPDVQKAILKLIDAVSRRNGTS